MTDDRLSLRYKKKQQKFVGYKQKEEGNVKMECD